MKLELDTTYSEQCLRKIRYRSSVSVALRARRLEQRRGVALRWYHCPFCFGYHLAKRK